MSIDVAEVYRGPLATFVERRSDLARRLKAGGDAKAAAEVTRLRKPSVSVWAIDQLAHEAADLVCDLLAAGADAIAAQRAAASSAAGGDAIHMTSSTVRQLLAEAGRIAEAILEEAGLGTTQATMRRIAITLHAAVTGGPAEREALWRGTLDRDLDPRGFEVEGAGDDSPKLAQAIASRRRHLPVASERTAHDRGERDAMTRAVRAAENELAEKLRAADRARETARLRGGHAKRLAEDARQAAERAAAAELEAEEAEKAAAATRDALTALKATDTARRRQ